jgi:hypothetical protein
MIEHHSHKFYDIKPLYGVDTQGNRTVSVSDSDYQKIRQQILKEEEQPMKFHGASALTDSESNFNSDYQELQRKYAYLSGQQDVLKMLQALTLTQLIPSLKEQPVILPSSMRLST